MNPLGTQIRETRLQRGIGLRELARRVGINPSQLSEIERGLRAAQLPTLERIAAELDLSLALVP